MKQSRYNHYLEKEEYSYWYNPLYNQFFRVPINVGRKLHEFLLEHNDLRGLSNTLHQKFIKSKFLIEDDTDELEIVRKCYQMAINNKNAFLIILPTLNCNYKCWYCIQDHIVSRMSEDTMDAVLRHVDYMINVQKIESLRVDWFGGEPFMYYRQVVKPLTQAIIKKCEDAGIPYMTTSTTNAYFLTKEVTKELGDLKFTSFQITLDGDRENHDKVKFMNGLDSAFDRALSNIDRILSEHESIYIHLRINYTQTNLSTKIVDEVCERISVPNRCRVIIMPKRVWQEKPDKNMGDSVDGVVRRFSQMGFKTQLWSPSNNFMPCYASSKYYKTINHNGFAVKCTACNDLYLDRPRGKITKDGSIEWIDSFEEKNSEASFENEKCLNCSILPACMGLCPRNYRTHPDGCNYNGQDTSFETLVVSYIDEQYRRMRDNQY